MRENDRVAGRAGQFIRPRYMVWENVPGAFSANKGADFAAVLDEAEKRLKQTIRAGFVPYAMLYRDEAGETDQEWRRFQREWCRPMIVGKKFDEERKKKEEAT